MRVLVELCVERVEVDACVRVYLEDDGDVERRHQHGQLRLEAVRQLLQRETRGGEEGSSKKLSTGAPHPGTPATHSLHSFTCSVLRTAFVASSTAAK